MKLFLLVCSFVSFAFIAISQSNPYIKVISPDKQNNKVSSSKQFITGNTCKDCKLLLNNREVKVYKTGAFVCELNLKEGDTSFVLVASNGKKEFKKIISFSYKQRPPDTTTTQFAIERIQIFPEGNLVLKTGDKIQLRIKAQPGCIVQALDKVVLHEQPIEQNNAIAGMYQAEYTIQPTDTLINSPIPFKLMKKNSDSNIVQSSTYKYSFNTLRQPFIVKTKGRLAFLKYGLGEDRLGGAKIGYLDSNISLSVTGKFANNYRVQLAPNKTAYIEDSLVVPLPEGAFTPQSLSTNWRAFGDEIYDYVMVSLSARLPYQTMQWIQPSKIVVDIFGATNNTNWIIQYETLKEIKNLYYEQLQDGVLRMHIELQHEQFWGHQVYYRGNNLFIRIKHQPKDLSLNKMLIAVDAGHGGSNSGAVGATGLIEKDITLLIAKELQRQLLAQGAKVIMTRTEETFFDNKERILFYRDTMPDLLISIHLNSSADPLRVGGTSTYYRHIGFRMLSELIYKRLLELGLKEYGNVGSFNFMLNSPTEYPNALIETLFISNPEEEEKILDENFRKQMAQKIILGIKDFLENCKK